MLRLFPLLAIFLFLTMPEQADACKGILKHRAVSRVGLATRTTVRVVTAPARAALLPLRLMRR